MSQLEEIIKEIHEQIGPELLSTDIVDKNGVSIIDVKETESLPQTNLQDSKPLPAPNFRGTDFRVRPEETAPAPKKKPESKPAGTDIVVTSKQLARVMNLSTEFCKALKMGAVEDNLITTDAIYVLSRFLGDGSYLWVLTLQRSATIGTIRMTMNEMAAKLTAAIP